MNLIIDIGNTQTKIAIVSNKKVVDKITTPNCSNAVVADFCKKHSAINKVIVASVQEKPTDLLAFLESKFTACYFFDAELPIPISNNYQSKNTLGYDRLAACIGAWSIYPNQHLLVIDAGTAITFDMMIPDNIYIGGCISPGIAMRFKALNQFTKKLPLLEKENQFQLIGTDTHSAIIGGVQNGVIFEIDGYISQLQKEYVNLKVLVTGGDTSFICEHSSKQVEGNIDLVLLGLNTILNYQTH